MKFSTLTKFLLAFTFLWSSVLFSQGSPQIFVSYGNPAINIPNNGTISFGASTEISFTIINVPTNGNSSLVLQNPSITLSNTNFVISSPPTRVNIKRDEFSVFKIRKNNFNCNSVPASTVITINSNANNYPVFSFTINFTNAPLISVLGGTPTQPVPDEQTIPTSFNGTLFGTVDVLASTTRTYAIVNAGTCPLTLNSLTCLTYNPETGLPSPDFAIIALTSANIAPGGVGYLVVRFTPQSTGTKWAIITIPNNDATKNPYNFVIKGDGYNPTITGPGGVNADFRLWLKATRGINLATGSKVALWKDLGSTGKDATQTVVANQPTYIDAASSNINFNPVVKFENNGSMLNQFLYNTENGYYTHETFIVMEADGAIGSPMTIISGTSAAFPAYPTVPNEHTGIGLGDFTGRLSNEKLWFNQWQTTGDPHYTIADDLGSYIKAGIINTRNKTSTPANGIDLLFNSNNVSNQTNISTSLTYTNVGYDDSGLWKGTPYNIGKNINDATYGNLNGRVAEVISYASRVPDADRPKIETYLALKYGITLGVNGTSKNYVDSGGSVIWNSTTNAGYNYNIAGIGEDVGSDLSQKQSKSLNDSNEVTIGLGVISTTNKANINQFKKNRDFLIWGSDNGTYTASGTNTSTLGAGVTTSTTRINKKWKVVETKADAAGDVENIYIGIPAAAFSAFPKLSNEEYALIVSDNANFSDADIIDIIPLKSDGVGNLQTWYDFDGTKYFTFGKALKLEGKYHVNIAAGPDFLVGEYALNLNSGSFTVACWLRNDGSSTASRTIFSKGANLELKLNAEHKVEAFWDGASRFVSKTPVADGKWHYIVGVFYVGSADLYIDGVVETSTFNLSNPTPNYSRFSLGNLYIDKNNVVSPFRGEIDELQIWDLALTSDQINYIMNQEIMKHTDNTVTGKVIPQNIAKNELKTILWSKLRAYYDFNAYYGTVAEGLTDDRNYLRIKYLNKNKQMLSSQTAPLPYETVADGLWSNSAIWKNGSLQTIPNNLSIITDLPNQKINGNIVKILHNVESTGNKTLLGLIIEGTDVVTYKTLLANNNTKVEVSHYLKLDGLLNLTGRSQLVQTLNSDLDPTSKGFIKRSQQGTVNKYNYNYWSSPVGPINAVTNNNDYTINGVFKDGTTATPSNINWIGGYDGSSGTPISLARYWLYKFENGTQYANWLQIDENSPIRPSQSFTLKGDGPVDETNTITQNYTFVGKPNNGFINGTSILADNLFLVGNPYPSAIDAFEFIKDNISIANGGYRATGIITGALYFWQHSPNNNSHYLAGYTGGYAMLTLTGGTPPIAPAGINGVGAGTTKVPYQYIPVGQGFFVKGEIGISGAEPILFNNNQRSFIKEDAFDDAGLQISNTTFRNNSNITVDPFSDNSNDRVYNFKNPKIRLGFVTTTNLHRQLLIGFMNENATDGLDQGYDGRQLDTQISDVYFMINDKEFTIQGVGAFGVGKKYPLGVKMDTIGRVKFMIDESQFLPANQKIYIYDKQTSIYYDITQTPAEVKLSAGTFNNRFELTFQTDRPSTIIGENELSESNLLVYNNDLQNKLYVVKNKSVEIREISVYDINGRQLFTMKKVPNTKTIEIPFNVAPGVYLVNVTTTKEVISKKVLKQ
ncbi:LamG-like jellyroll fold domain-containing protein [Flavobacterium sp. GT3R68]|uniref:LamG-like jellyroll fold domain-containing protein n=1 Tax=Flavobacterium sp. GT3R68 TaxID=2594437 RepID=UPI000F88D0FE|nr:LamG-like jellyroll fold domain-containing protein [Flavobacterium sp. GT3R68]RTY86612.1 T9SS type A sorting domain-containing protein [Flavobacterium sp. GSN2]TRW92353.1 T9SS type A sorting domain-containing protein [Flavobacterium sp. GT3R68]